MASWKYRQDHKNNDSVFNKKWQEKKKEKEEEEARFHFVSVYVYTFVYWRTDNDIS